MGRPPLPVGTYGKIKTTKVGSVFEARARFRTATGDLRRMKRTGKTKTAAENNLRSALSELGDEVRGGEISSASKFSAVAEQWFREMKIEADAGARSHNSVSNYRTYLKHHLYPALGELRMREISVSVCDRLQKAKQESGMKYDALVHMRAVLSSVCGFAVRQGAMSANPVRDVTRVVRGENDVKEVRALTFEERTDLFAKLDADPKAVQYELPDLLRGMLATGLRIGELVATIGDDFSKDPRSGKPVLRADWRIVRVTGVGLVRKRRTNSSKGVGQRLLLPSWAVPMFTARKLASGGDGPLFPHVVTREWRDPGGALQRQLRDALDRAGYTWVTSHVMRKTVANVLDQAGVDTGLVAAQLGQRSKEITERHYIERRVSNDGAEQVLETMWAQAGGRSQSGP